MVKIPSTVEIILRACIVLPLVIMLTGLWLEILASPVGVGLFAIGSRLIQVGLGIFVVISWIIAFAIILED